MVGLVEVRFMEKLLRFFKKSLLLIMDGFDYKNGELVCKRCGSRNVSVRAGMMTDRAICNSCGNEDYI